MLLSPRRAEPDGSGLPGQQVLPRRACHRIHPPAPATRPSDAMLHLRRHRRSGLRPHARAAVCCGVHGLRGERCRLPRRARRSLEDAGLGAVCRSRRDRQAADRGRRLQAAQGDAERAKAHPLRHLERGVLSLPAPVPRLPDTDDDAVRGRSAARPERAGPLVRAPRRRFRWPDRTPTSFQIARGPRLERRCGGSASICPRPAGLRGDRRRAPSTSRSTGIRQQGDRQLRRRNASRRSHLDSAGPASTRGSSSIARAAARTTERTSSSPFPKRRSASWPRNPE